MSTFARCPSPPNKTETVRFIQKGPGIANMHSWRRVIGKALSVSVGLKFDGRRDARYSTGFEAAISVVIEGYRMVLVR